LVELRSRSIYRVYPTQLGGRSTGTEAVLGSTRGAGRPRRPGNRRPAAGSIVGDTSGPT